MLMTTLKILCNYSTPDGVVWGDNKGIYQPEEMPAYLRELFEVKKGKQDKSELRVTFINNLRQFGLDIITVLHVLGYTESPINDTKKMPSKSYTYLVGDNMCFYTIKVKFSKRYVVQIIDSDNFLSISDPYDMVNTWGNGTLTVKDLVYAYTQAISQMLKMTDIHTKIPLTISGVARRVYSHMQGNRWDIQSCTSWGWNNIEPWFRGCYHGGINLKADEGIIKEYGKGIVLDCNSLYPYVMKYGGYPVGKPWKISKEHFSQAIARAKQKKGYFFVQIRASFRLKPDGIPCVAMNKNDKQRWYHDKQWMIDSAYVKPDGSRCNKLQMVNLYLNQTDYFLFLSNYDIEQCEFVDCYEFQYKEGLFTDYIDQWYGLKKVCTGGNRRIAKILLNSLSGSMARRIDYVNGTVKFDDKTGRAKIVYTDSKVENPKCFVHIGSAITSYARAMMINLIREHKDRWLYSDTDSLHLIGTDIPDGIKISDEMGQFKIEKRFDNICYYKLKEYGYHDNNGYHFTLAGVERRDVEDLEKLVNHRTGTRDLWINSKSKSNCIQLLKGKDPLLDVYYNGIPTTLKYRSGWFDYKYLPTQHKFFDASAHVIDPVHINTKPVSIPELKDKDKKKDEYYEKKHKDDVIIPVDEWLELVHRREQDGKQKDFDAFQKARAIQNHAWMDAQLEDLKVFK